MPETTFLLGYPSLSGFMAWGLANYPARFSFAYGAPYVISYGWLANSKLLDRQVSEFQQDDIDMLLLRRNESRIKITVSADSKIDWLLQAVYLQWLGFMQMWLWGLLSYSAFHKKVILLTRGTYSRFSNYKMAQHILITLCSTWSIGSNYSSKGSSTYKFIYWCTLHSIPCLFWICS